jgi:hypothetical protein
MVKRVRFRGLAGASRLRRIGGELVTMSYALRPYLLVAALVLPACAESPENEDPSAEESRGDAGRSRDDDEPPSSRDAGVRRDAGSSSPSVGRDGGSTGSSGSSGGSSTPRDAGSSGGSGGATDPFGDILNGIIGVFNPGADAGARDAGGRDGG